MVDSEGTKIVIGDVVEFKADIEQCGRIVSARRIEFGEGFTLVLEAGEGGFEGGYIGGQMRTTMRSDDVYKA